VEEQLEPSGHVVLTNDGATLLFLRAGIRFLERRARKAVLALLPFLMHSCLAKSQV